MAKFVMNGQNPTEFRKCQLDYDTSEFCDGKKKNFIITLNSMQLHPEENLYSQAYYQGKSQLMVAGKEFGVTKQKESKSKELNNLSKQQIKEKFGMSKLQLKQFQKACIALKVGIAKEREYGIILPYEKSPIRQISSAKNGRIPSNQAFSTLKIETATEDDTNMDFFSYLQQHFLRLLQQKRELDVRPQSVRAPGPQFRGKKQYFVESDRMDRIESDSRTTLLEQIKKDKTLQENQKEKLNEKSNNSLVLRQHPTGHVQTDAAEKYLKYLAEYEKNKPNFKKHVIVQKGKKGEMSSMYPPMFERAKLTKKLYYHTAYQMHYPLYQGYLKPKTKCYTSEFNSRNMQFNS